MTPPESEHDVSDLQREDVQSYPRPPALEPVAQTIVIRLGGALVARSSHALRVLETHHAPTYYLPPADVGAHLRPVTGATRCEWKGVAHYFDVTAGGTVENRRSFATPQDTNADGTTDGLAVDVEGNVYTTGPGGVWVYAPDGQRLARIAVPKATTNVAFGGPDRKTLYITARPHVYRVSVNVPGKPTTE